MATDRNVTDAEFVEAFEARLHRREIADLFSISMHAVQIARKRIIAAGIWTPPADMAASDWTGKKKAMPSQDVLVAAFKSGKPMAAIKKELGMSDTATYAARKKLEDAGILSKEDRGGRVLPSDRVMAETFRDGRSIEELVETWGAGKSTIYKAKQRLEEAGMLKNNVVAEAAPDYSTRFARKLPPEPVVIEAFASGRSLEDLAKEWNVSLHLVAQTRRELFRVGISGKRIGKNRVKDRVLRQLFESGRSTREIAAVLGVTTQAAYLSRRKLEERTGPVVVRAVATPAPNHAMRSDRVNMFDMAKGLLPAKKAEAPVAEEKVPAGDVPTFPDPLPIVEAFEGAHRRVSHRVATMLVAGKTIGQIADAIGFDRSDVYGMRDDLLGEGRIVVRTELTTAQRDLEEICDELGIRRDQIDAAIERLAEAGIVRDLRPDMAAHTYALAGHPKGAGKEF